MKHFKIRTLHTNITIDSVTARKLDLDNPDDRWLFQRWVFAWPLLMVRRLLLARG